MKFWRRFTKLHIGDKIISSNDFDIYFKIETSTDETADTAEIIIYNLSDITKQGFMPEQIVNLKAGYEQDYGTVFVGKISTIEDEFEGADIKTTIICMSDMTKLLGGYVNKSYAPGTQFTTIVKDQIQLAGITNFQIDTNPNFYIVQKKYTSATSIHENITEIAKMMNYTFTERRGSVLLISKLNGIRDGFILNSDSGLISAKKAQQIDGEQTHDYEVTALLNYQVDKGSIIEIQSRLVGTKFCRVEECIFQSNASESIMTLKLKIL